MKRVNKDKLLKKYVYLHNDDIDWINKIKNKYKMSESGILRLLIQESINYRKFDANSDNEGIL
jgi:hypothetical protein